MTRMRVIASLLVISGVSVHGEAEPAIVSSLKHEADLILKPGKYSNNLLSGPRINLSSSSGYPGYKAPSFSLAPRLPEPRSLFYRKTPGVEKYQSPVHELYMRPYNYVSYSMGGSKPVQYNYHYQTHTPNNPPAYKPYSVNLYHPPPQPYSPTPQPPYSPSAQPHYSPTTPVPFIKYSTPAPFFSPTPSPFSISTPAPLPSLPDPPTYASFSKVSPVQ